MSTNRRKPTGHLKTNPQPIPPLTEATTLKRRERRAPARGLQPASASDHEAPSPTATGQPTANGANPTHEIPTLSRAPERAAATERARAYPYRFPRDRRQLGGKFSVEESARRL